LASVAWKGGKKRTGSRSDPTFISVTRRGRNYRRGVAYFKFGGGRTKNLEHRKRKERPDSKHNEGKNAVGVQECKNTILMTKRKNCPIRKDSGKRLCRLAKGETWGGLQGGPSNVPESSTGLRKATRNGGRFYLCGGTGSGVGGQFREGNTRSGVERERKTECIPILRQSRKATLFSAISTEAWLGREGRGKGSIKAVS